MLLSINLTLCMYTDSKKQNDIYGLHSNMCPRTRKIQKEKNEQHSVKHYKIHAQSLVSRTKSPRENIGNL